MSRAFLVQRDDGVYSKLLKEFAISDLVLEETLNSGRFFAAQKGKWRSENGQMDIVVVHPQQGE